MNQAPVRIGRGRTSRGLAAAALILLALGASPAFAAAGAPTEIAWWVWPLALFVVCFLLGIVAVPAGVGGGVLFVPIVSGFFPFHLDFVRGAGLLVALASALAAGPNLLRVGLADLRLALPLALLASASSIAGAMIGLALPAATVQTALGATILGIVALMAMARKSELPTVTAPDRLSAALGIHGVFHDGASGRDIDWRVHRTPGGLVLFTGIGMLAGIDGPGGIDFSDAGLTQAVGSICLVFILFSGGLETRWSETRPVAKQAFSLATLGVLLTALSVGFFAHMVFGVPLLYGLLLGSISVHR